RQRADAGLNTRRCELSKQVEKQIGVIQPLLRGPVRRVNVFFYFSTVEASKGKAVNREDVRLVFAKPALEFKHGCAIGQFVRGAIAQAEADGVGLFRADAFTDAQGVFV